MSFHPAKLGRVLVCVCVAWPSTVWADDPRIDELSRQLRDVQRQLNELKAAHSRRDEVAVLRQSTEAQFADLHKRMDAQTRVSMPNGRLTAISPDGTFSVALRATVQFDAGYFAHDHKARCRADRALPRRA